LRVWGSPDELDSLNVGQLLLDLKRDWGWAWGGGCGRSGDGRKSWSEELPWAGEVGSSVC